MSDQKVYEYLCKKLEETGLPNDPKEVNGRQFTFGDEEHAISGMIRSIGCGSHEGVKLYVSSPRFRGIEIQGLVRREGRWFAVAADGSERPGLFRLL